MILPPPFRLQQFGRIDSSNDAARRLAQNGASHGLVVTAEEQSAGRGRRGRVWHSPSGNLHASLLLDAGPSAAAAPQLTFVAAVALRDALAELALGADFRVKWPNDILCDGAKIAGMLLEREGPLIILGVGVNIIACPESPLYPATYLRRTGSGADKWDVLSGFCSQLERRYAQWRSGGFAPVRAAWLAGASGQGDRITARLADGSALEGIFAGLAEDGALELTDAAGEAHRILAGDVFFSGNDGRNAAGN